jgi:hypothetical protein
MNYTLVKLNNLLNQIYTNDIEGREDSLAYFRDEIINCFTLLLNEFKAGNNVPFSELESFAQQLSNFNDNLPETIKTSHENWEFNQLPPMILQQLQYRPPQGQPVISLEIEGVLYTQIEQLRYLVHKSQSPFSCDCRVLVELKMYREPSSRVLQKLGRAFDGYYEGDYFKCEECGTYWFRSEVHTESQFSFSWEPASEDFGLM